MSARYDAVVVGAGPAGSVTALLLARAGHRVALLDRRVFPRAKPCGDCLSPEATRVLDRLGVLAAVEATAPARLDGWRIWAHDGGSFAGTFARAAGADARVQHALAIPRERLDQVLLDAACAAGAELLSPMRVDQLLWTDGRVAGVLARDDANRERRLEARVVVGADGLRSVVARRAGAVAPAGALRKLSLTAHARLRADFTAGTGEMHVVPDGCIGIAPVEMGARPLHNVTFVTLSRARGATSEHTMHALMRAAPGLSVRAPELLEALAGAERPLASGPFDRPVRFTVADGLALVGDAAGYYDPFTGQGVFQALSGAEQLAAVLDDALRATPGAVSTAALRPYAQWVARTRRPARSVQRMIEFVTARPSLMNRCARAIDHAPRFADALVAVTGDIAPVRALGGAPLLSLAGGFIETRAGSVA